MRRSERLILAAILFIGAALRLWGLRFGVPHLDTQPGETALVTTLTGLINDGGNPTTMLIVLRVLSAAAGVATIWLVYRLAERFFDRLTAITAAFFVAIAFLHVRDSHFGDAEVATTALIVAAVLTLLSAIDDPTYWRRWALGAALAGLAASTKYYGAVLAPDSGIGIGLDREWLHHLTFSLWYGLGAPLLVAGLGGVTLIAATSWKKAVMILTFPIVYYATVGRGHTAREITPVVPFLCIVAAFLLVRIVQRFARPESSPRLVALVAVALALPSIARDLAFDVLIRRTDTRVLAQEWIATHVAADDSIGQIPPVLIYPDFGIAKPVHLATFDINRKAFVSAAGATISPEWMLVPTSPLTAYTVSSDELATIANRDYVRETSIPATTGPEMSGWFDQRDLFFMPFTTFTMRDRPGPEIQIFRRRH
jgi:Dolichyl-phosphate-mannose-protein mannosyltransferase